MEKIKLFNKEVISNLTIRLAHEIIEKNSDLNNLAIVGIRTRGDIIAKRVIQLINEIKKTKLKDGTQD